MEYILSCSDGRGTYIKKKNATRLIEVFRDDLYKMNNKNWVVTLRHYRTYLSAKTELTVQIVNEMNALGWRASASRHSDTCSRILCDRRAKTHLYAKLSSWKDRVTVYACKQHCLELFNRVHRIRTVIMLGFKNRMPPDLLKYFVTTYIP